MFEQIPDIFETGSRLKVRFDYKGVCVVEDLWDIPLEAADNIFKELSYLTNASVVNIVENVIISTNNRRF